MSRIEVYKEKMRDKSLSNEEVLKCGEILEELIAQRMELLEEFQRLYPSEFIRYDVVLDILKV